MTKIKLNKKALKISMNNYLFMIVSLTPYYFLFKQGVINQKNLQISMFLPLIQLIIIRYVYPMFEYKNLNDIEISEEKIVFPSVLFNDIQEREFLKENIKVIREVIYEKEKSTRCFQFKFIMNDEERLYITDPLVDMHEFREALIKFGYSREKDTNIEKPFPINMVIFIVFAILIYVFKGFLIK